MKWTKLDRYDYLILKGIIRIKLNGTNDPDLVDIMSEIDRSDGRIYVEGDRFIYLDEYHIVNGRSHAYLELSVAEM